METVTATSRYANVLSAIAGDVWPIMPQKMEAILQVIELRAAGLCDESFTVPPEAATKGRPRAVRGSVAVLQIYGVMAQRMNMLTATSGGTSTELIGQDFDAAMNDDSIGAIVLDVDSPGGAMAGVPELSARIFEVRGRKPIIAIANSLMASAAYWVAASADEIYAAPSADVGSIGVVAMHTDVSEAEAMGGVKTTLVYAGECKVDGNPFEPLADGARTDIQARVDDAYEMFLADVARGRGGSSAAVRSGYGKGRVLSAKAAKTAGLVEGIATLDQVIAKLDARRKDRSRTATAARQRVLDIAARG